VFKTGGLRIIIGGTFVETIGKPARIKKTLRMTFPTVPEGLTCRLVPINQLTGRL